MKLHTSLLVSSFSLLANLLLSDVSDAEKLQIQGNQIVSQSRIHRTRPDAVCFLKDGEYSVGWLLGSSKASKRVVDTFNAATLSSRLEALENHLASKGSQRMGVLRRTELRFLRSSITKIVEFENQCVAPQEATPTPTMTDPTNGISFKDLLSGRVSGGTVDGAEGGVDSLVVTVDGTRPTCVAPCAVFAKASSPTVAGGERDASQMIDFDATDIDPTNPHNKEKQRAAAHVYTAPGVYQIVAAVQGAFGETGISAPITVTVQDPNVIYNPANGGRTICVTNNANPGFANCPSYAQQVVTQSLGSTFSSFLAPISSTQPQIPTRIMLKEGAIWTGDALWWAPYGVSQALITSFSNPANPVRPKFISNSPYTYSDIAILKGNNLTIENLEIQGNFTPGVQSFSQSTAFAIDDSDYILIRNVKVTGTGSNVFTLGGNDVQHLSRHTVIADNEIRDISGYGFYASSNWTAIIYNTLRNAYTRKHMLRVQDVDNNPDNLIISKNDFGYDVTIPFENRPFTCITVRGDTDGVTLVGNSCEEPITARPMDDEVDDLISDVIVDGNIVKPAPGESVGWIAFQCLATNVTFRNNLMLNVSTGFSIPATNPHAPGCSGAIYNNTYINTASEGAGPFIDAAAIVSPQFMFNNIYQASSTSSSALRVFKYPASNLPSLISAYNIIHAPLQNSGWAMFERLGTSSGSFTLQQWQSLGVLEVGTQIADPQLSGTTFTPSSSSPAVDQGIPIAAYDIAGTSRSRDGNGDNHSWQDIGAKER